MIPALKLFSWSAKSVISAVSEDIVWYSNSSFSTKAALTSSIKIWFDWLYYSMTLKMNSLCFVSKIITSIGKSYKNIEYFCCFFRISNSQSSNVISLNSSVNEFVENFCVSKIGILVKVFCCLFEYLFLRHFDENDRKYRNATALPASWFSEWKILILKKKNTTKHAGRS